MKINTFGFILILCLFSRCSGESVAQDLSAHPIQTREIVVRLKNINPYIFANKRGIVFSKVLEAPIFGDNVYLYYIKSNTLKHASRQKFLYAELTRNDNVIWWRHQSTKQQHKRSLFVTDPKYHNQWHLHGVAGVSLGIEAVLKKGIDGKGVTIAIVDDGVEALHPDFRHRFVMANSWDFNGYNGHNPTPYSRDGHGTCAAGMAGAGRNSVCGIGTASGCILAGIRLIAGPTTDLQEAYALSYKRDEIDIYSNSWGPRDSGKSFMGPGRLTRGALERGAKHGRKGLGNLFVWAGGNGRAQKDNCNRDGYANSRHVVTVGAINSHGQQTFYSEPCAELHVVVPSSGNTKRITTTDLSGRAGYSGTECTDKFGGTSAAAPQVAGVIACMLQVNPKLTKRDVEGVLAKSAVKIHPTQSGWSTNKKGFHHHHSYGFGRVDMSKTMQVAKTWKNLPAQKTFSSNLVTINKNIRKVSSKTKNEDYHIAVPASANISSVEHIELKIALRHPHRGHIQVSIQSPEGITSILAEFNFDRTADYPSGGWKFGSVRHWGEKATGQWTVIVRDNEIGSTVGIVDWVKLSVFGS